MFKKTLVILAFILLNNMSGCSDPTTIAATIEANSTSLTTAPPYNSEISIREIMGALIDPHADTLWNAVKVVSDINGITEYFPETDEEWAALRISAVTIIEGSNSLMMPGRAVAPPGASGEFPEYEFTPEEVAVKLADDPVSWNSFSVDLQDAAFDLLNAIDARNTDALSESGAYLDEACEACHSVYWYRAGI